MDEDRRHSDDFHCRVDADYRREIAQLKTLVKAIYKVSQCGVPVTHVEVDRQMIEVSWIVAQVKLLGDA